MSDLQLAARLQAVLGDAYTVERELGGGGMSRLFVATERSLNRQVVVKVLPPELASEVSAARFDKEIELAARLQHPHIVPILAVGTDADLLYYIMPFVRGETLRHRMVAGGALPVRDAVRILVEVADALAYAHRQGIVHRDIKPENILIEEGHAVLADFGVARAIVAARAASALEGANLTLTGTSVGTPTYMAPEQAAGESDIDARADIYALGIIGYEMLAGRHPFGAGSTQSMIVAHLTEPAPPLIKARADVPLAVNAAIARALVKKPSERFQTAEAFRDALEGTHTGARGSRAGLLAAGAVVAALIVLFGIYFSRRTRAAPLDANLVAIAPFDVVDADLKLWHEGMVDVLSRNLDGAGPLRTVSPTLVVRRWAGRGDKESAAALGRATGAQLAIFGTIIRSGTDSVRGSASLVDASSGKVLGQVDRRDAFSRMDRLSDSLTIGLLRELGKTRALGGAQMSSVGTTSLTALKFFLQGQQYFRHSAWDSAVANYDRAIAADSTFSIALSADNAARGWLGGPGDSLGIVYAMQAARFNHGLAPRDSLLVAAAAEFATLASAPNIPPLPVQRALLATLHEAVQRYPTDPVAWYSLADAQYHWAWGPGIGVSRQEVLRSFDRSIALDSAFTPAYIHAIELSFRYGTANGRRYLTGYLAQNPTEVDAEGMRVLARLSDPALVHTPETKRMLDTTSVDGMMHAATAAVSWADSADSYLKIRRLLTESSAARRPGHADSTFVQRQLAYGLAARGRVAEALKLYSSGDILTIAAFGGIVPIQRASAALEQDILKNRCAPCAISALGMYGDTLAIQRLHGVADSVLKHPSSMVDIGEVRYTIALGDAYIVLARRDSASALAKFMSLPDSLCHGCGFAWFTTAQLLEAAGKNAEAATVLDQVGVVNNVPGVFGELERGRIAEKLGDTTRARDAYAFVADYWQHADSGSTYTQMSGTARAGLKRLSGENAGTNIPVHKP